MVKLTLKVKGFFWKGGERGALEFELPKAHRQACRQLGGLPGSPGAGADRPTEGAGEGARAALSALAGRQGCRQGAQWPPGQSVGAGRRRGPDASRTDGRTVVTVHSPSLSVLRCRDEPMNL